MGLIESLASGPLGDGDGGDGGDGGETPPEDEDRKPRVKTSTKLVIIAAVWVLFTLFLIGRFSSEEDAIPSARLDTNVADDGGDGTLEVVDSEEEAALDVDGDGLLTPEEQGLVDGSVEGSSADGGGSDGDGAGGGGATAGEAGVYEGTPTASSAVPGPAPGGGSTGTTTGGTRSTTTTAAPGGGGGGGGGSATTAKPATTTTTGQQGGPPPPPALPDKTINIVDGSPGAFDPANLTVPRGTRVKVVNKDAQSHGWKVQDKEYALATRDAESSFVTFDTPGTYNYSCTIHANSMKGTITVT